MSAFYSRALTWWTILRIALAERLAYRGDFALGTLMRLLSGSLHGAGRFLVAGGQLAAVRLYAVQLLFVGTHVSTRHAARALALAGRVDTADVPGVFSGGRSAREDSRPRTFVRPDRRN